MFFFLFFFKSPSGFLFIFVPSLKMPQNFEKCIFVNSSKTFQVVHIPLIKMFPVIKACEVTNLQQETTNIFSPKVL